MNEKPQELQTKSELSSEREQRGENVTIHAVFTRHGEKVHDPDNPETPLTPEGEAGSKAAGEKRPAVDAIKSYTSKTQRTEDTGKFMVEGSPTDNKMTQRIRDNLGFHYEEESPFMKELMDKKKEILGDNYNDLQASEQIARLEKANSVMTDLYLKFGADRPDETTYSPVETAATMAQVVDRYVSMADKLNTDSEIDLINATHDFNLAAFLKEVMIRNIDGENVTGFDSIDEIGGAVGFNEGFELLIKNDADANKSLKILFRDEEYDIDQDRLAELVQIAKDLKTKDESK